MATSKDRVVIRECSSQKSKRYYRAMLHKIAIIKESLLVTLSCSRHTHLSLPNSSRPASLSQVKKKKGKFNRNTSRAESLKDNRDSKTTIFRQGKEFPREKVILRMASQIKTSSELLTPKVKKKEYSIFSSPNCYFDSPFDECVFDKAETVRKVCLPRPACFSGKESNLILPQLCSRGDINWQKWSSPIGSKPEEQVRRRSKYKEEDKENALSKVERPKGDTKDEWRGLGSGDVNQLERDFQLCLMKKKGSNSQQQSALRERMTEISYRIAKIKENSSNSHKQT